MSGDGFDLCAYCCEWAHGLEGKSPLSVKDAYPKMMRKVLMRRFGMPKAAAKQFVWQACCGNWLKLHETDMERHAGAEDYADALVWDVYYCSDRWSWDRVMRVQWLYMRLRDRCEKEVRE